MRVLSIEYNSSGYLQIFHNDNATDKRILQILKRAVRKQEKKIKGES